MNGYSPEKLENEARILALLKEIDDMVSQYKRAVEAGQNLPEVERMIEEKLPKTIKELEGLDPNRVSEEARNILKDMNRR